MNLPAGFDVHGPANLAPICSRPCNGEKRNSDFTQVPRLMSVLERARMVEPAVIRAVRRFADTDAVGVALVTLLEADITDSAIGDAIEQYAPEVVRRMAVFGHDVTAHVIADTVEIPGILDVSGTVPVGIASRVEAAVRTPEHLCDRPAHEVLDDGVAYLVETLCRRAEENLQDYDDEDGHGPASPGEAQPTDLRLTLDTVEITRDGNRIEFTFSGDFNGVFTNQLARTDIRGDGLEYLEAETEATGQFSFRAEWTISTGTGAGPPVRRRRDHPLGHPDGPGVGIQHLHPHPAPRGYPVGLGGSRTRSLIACNSGRPEMRQ